MCCSVFTRISHKMKNIFRKSPPKEGVPLTGTSLETEPTVDLDLASDALLSCQDPDLWFGKSVFWGIVAEVVRKDLAGHAAITLLDTLESVVHIYAPFFAENYKGTAYIGFYRYICNMHEHVTDNEWSNFRTELAHHIAASCRRLLNEKVLELPATPAQSPEIPRAPTSATEEIDGGSSASSWSSSSRSPIHQSPVSNPATIEEYLRTREPLQAPAGLTSAPAASPMGHRYVCALQEYASVHGGELRHHKREWTSIPVSWHCTTTFGGFSGEGVGPSFQKAKHAASKQICDAMGLRVQ